MSASKSIPVNWYNGPSRAKSAGSTSAIINPTADHLAAYANGEVQVCGHCRFFELEKGQQEMAKQRFAERLVREQEWKLQHLGAPMEMMGLCGATNGDTATGFMTKACDQYRQVGRRR